MCFCLSPGWQIQSEILEADLTEFFFLLSWLQAVYSLIIPLEADISQQPKEFRPGEITINELPYLI